MQLRHAALSVAACLSLAASEPSMSTAPSTRAESSGFEETSRYDDVRAFLDRLAAISPLVHLDAFGTSEEGRPLPLVILSKDGAKPDPARRGREPVVLVMANIHAGEVEGKEAAQNLLRRLVVGDLRALTMHLTVLVAPIYNADGNERLSLDHRTVQNGPVGGVGTRENAKGLDLNRDYIKAESAETRALLSLITAWDPAVVIDLHTTNGSFHGYHLTWAPALSPNTDSRIADFTRTVLLPPVERSLADAGWRLHRYGNFASAASIESEAEDAASASNPVWRTFDYRARFGNNYVGLRNRIAVLSEAYSYLGFERRIAVTEAFVASVLREIDRQRDTIGRLVADVDRETARRASDGTLPPFAISATLASSEMAPVPILVGAVRAEKNPRSGNEMHAVIDDRHDPVVMRELDRFEPARSIPVPSAYIIPADVLATPDGPAARRPASNARHRVDANADRRVDSGRSRRDHGAAPRGTDLSGTQHRSSVRSRSPRATDPRGRCPPGFNRPTPFTARHTAARSGVRRWGGDVEWPGCVARAGQGRTRLSDRESALEARRGLKFGARPSIARTSRVGRGVMPCQ